MLYVDHDMRNTNIFLVSSLFIIITIVVAPQARLSTQHKALEPVFYNTIVCTNRKRDTFMFFYLPNIQVFIEVS